MYKENFHTAYMTNRLLVFAYLCLQVMFCHDHQNMNTECQRGNACRFIHCERQEEEEYRRSGYLPPHIRDQVKIAHLSVYKVDRYPNSCSIWFLLKPYMNQIYS